MATNAFLPHAIGAGSNVETDGSWSADANRLTGFQSGTAPSATVNKALRQGTVVASMIGQFIANYSGNNAADDGNITTLLNNYLLALGGSLPTLPRYGVDSGSVNTIVIASPSPALASLTVGNVVVFQSTHGNTGATTINVSGLGPQSLTTQSGGSLPTGTIASGGIYVAVYAGTTWQLVTGGSSSSSSSTPSGTVLQLNAGSAAINTADLVSVGGPGNHAYSNQTIDYAVIPTSGPIVNPTQLYGKAGNGGTRLQFERDKSANLIHVGINASGQLTGYKYSPTGVFVNSQLFDSNATGVYTAQQIQLSNGTFACVYSRGGASSGSMYFVIYDSGLNIIAGPTGITTEWNSSSVVYHSVTALAGGGFALVYQYPTTGVSIQFATYSNTGTAVVATTNIQTLASSAAQHFLKIRQLSNGNLLVVTRGAMTAAGTAGTNFVIVTTAGVSVVTATNVDSTASLGFVEVDYITGYFAISTQNGTNIVAAVYSNAGVLQGSAFTTADTYNFTGYYGFRLINDGVNFWLTYIGSANTGVNVVQLPTTGTGYVTASSFGAQTITSYFALDAAMVNGTIAVWVASSQAGGQYWMQIGLPDASTGAATPYLINNVNTLGAPAATTGSKWPRIVFGGDWTIILAYDQATNPGTFLSIWKIQPSAIIGVAQSTIAVGNTNALVTVYEFPGAAPINTIIGTSGLTFNHNTYLPSGAAGQLYTSGINFVSFGTFSGSANGSQGTVQLAVNPYVPVAQNDPIIINDDGYAYTALTTDYVANGNAATSIVVPTSIAYGFNPTLIASEVQSIVTATGTIIKLGAASATGGIVLYRFSPNGTITGSLTLNTSVALAAIGDPKIVLLYNGNISVSYVNISTATLYYAVVGPDAKYTILGLTAVETVYASSPGQHWLCAHPNGNFILKYQQATTGVTRFACYNSVGVQIVAPLTYFAWSGTPGRVLHNTVLLSNGYFGHVYISSWSSKNSGFWYSVSDAFGTQIMAPVCLLDWSLSVYDACAAHPPACNAMNGYWSFGCFNAATGVKAYQIYTADNYGNIIGSPWVDTFVSGAVQGVLRPKICNDGVNFWAVVTNTVGGFYQHVQIPVGVTGYQKYQSHACNTTAYTWHDAFWENGRIVTAYQNGGSYYLAHGSFNCNTQVLEYTNVSIYNSAAVYFPKCHSGGDFCAIRHFHTATPAHYYDVYSYSNAAFIGVAQNAASPGGTITVAEAGQWKCNALKGSANKTFNHTATTVVGNKGAIQAPPPPPSPTIVYVQPPQHCPFAPPPPPNYSRKGSSCTLVGIVAT